MDTPAGTLHHSGGGFIFDINAHNAATQTESVPFGGKMEDRPIFEFGDVILKDI